MEKSQTMFNLRLKYKEKANLKRLRPNGYLMLFSTPPSLLLIHEQGTGLSDCLGTLGCCVK